MATIHEEAAQRRDDTLCFIKSKCLDKYHGICLWVEGLTQYEQQIIPVFYLYIITHSLCLPQDYMEMPMFPFDAASKKVHRL
jgi:hypothetical protein